ncbi:MAG TPA: alanine racemase [Allosphingosinicella sp.]|nr:alanine racemase [Allosphingosinicella sp.]
MVHVPLRLKLDGDALVANWRWLADRGGGAACGAAIKADGYGLGARDVVRRLAEAGCRDFFVATWAEAEALMPWSEGLNLSVLHGVGEADLPTALSSPARPVLNSAQQVLRWKESDRPCDVMIDTGINRLGLAAAVAGAGLLQSVRVETLMSHLACADEDSPVNEKQRQDFIAAAAAVQSRRLSLANSAGICLGPAYAFDLTRPGLALYGGIPRPEAEGHVRQVVRIETQIIQRRRVDRGEGVGYNHFFRAEAPHELAILNLGYADGYLRSFSGTGRARLGEGFAPVLGRVSMDLTAICVDDAPHLQEGDWVEMDYDLAAASAQSGLSAYELLTGLGDRFERCWV